MLFNSFTYLLFFPIVCGLYFLIPAKSKNIFLLIASYYFYLNWEPVYCLLILFSSVVTWVCAYKIEKISKQQKRKLILVICLLLNLSVLGVFKYANFVSHSVVSFMELLHIKMYVPEFKLLLPVGISFYTFQAIGYTIDVYRKEIKAEKKFHIYALFVSFFPQLIAGPIERAKNFMPQFYQEHKFDVARVVEGLRLILWGYFMKVVIADRLTTYVDAVYNNAAHHSSITLIVATIFFTFQIYCDFGGYSNIAVGCAKIMGFNLTTNFNRPYLSTGTIEFWRRWHITLSTWFRDYVYIPLGGNRCSRFRNYSNLMVTFVLSGLWHGANWTFVIWGGLNGIFQVIEKAISPKRKINTEKSIIRKYSKIICTFTLITFTWIFFRANNVSDAFLIVGKITSFKGSLFTNNIDSLIYGAVLIFILVFSDILQENNNGKHFFLCNNKKYIRYFSYLFIVIIILVIGVFDSSQFIYFQF